MYMLVCMAISYWFCFSRELSLTDCPGLKNISKEMCFLLSRPFSKLLRNKSGS